MKKLAILILASISLFCAGVIKKNKAPAIEEIRAAEWAIRMEPENPLNYITLGDIYLKTEEYERALSQYDHALKLSDNSGSAWLGKGKALWRKNGKKQAVEIFKRLIDSIHDERMYATIGSEIGVPFLIEQITSGDMDCAFPNCNATVEKLIFQCKSDENWDIYSSSLDGNDFEQLTHHRARDESPAISPDGLNFVFTSTRDDSVNRHIEDTRRQIYISDRNNDLYERISFSAGDDWAPVFDDRGKRLMFISNRDYLSTGAPQEEDSEIYEIDLEKRQLRKITHMRGNKSLGCYYDSDKYILFSCNINGNYDIFSMKIGKNQIKPVYIGGGEDINPKMSHAGDHIAFCSVYQDNYDIYLIRMKDGQVIRLTCNRSIDGYPVFAPDDRKIFFHSNRTGTYHIFAVDLNRSADRNQVTDALAGMKY